MYHPACFNAYSLAIVCYTVPVHILDTNTSKGSTLCFPASANHSHKSNGTFDVSGIVLMPHHIALTYQGRSWKISDSIHLPLSMTGLPQTNVDQSNGSVGSSECEKAAAFFAFFLLFFVGNEPHMSSSRRATGSSSGGASGAAASRISKESSLRASCGMAMAISR
jgi:hypothetical protein